MKNILIFIQVATNVANIFAETTSTTTTFNPAEPCAIYQTLNASERLYSVPGNRGGCDVTLAEGWYKFEINGRLAEIPQLCMKNNVCGTQLPLRLDLGGRALPASGVELDAHVCTSYNVLGKWDCCVLRQSVKIKNCGGYYVYLLKGTDRCPVAYCAQEAGQMPSSELTIKPGEVYFDETPSSISSTLTTAQETSASPTTNITTTISPIYNQLCRNWDPVSCRNGVLGCFRSPEDNSTVVPCINGFGCGIACNNVPECRDGSDESQDLCVSATNNLCDGLPSTTCPNGNPGCYWSPIDNTTLMPCANGRGCGVVCDNMPDCRDGSDEAMCVSATNNLCDGLPSTTCPNGNPGCYWSPIDNTTLMPCANGRGCGVVCDNMPDCRDGSDEAMCDHVLCAEGQQKCSNSRGCFTRCDGVAECENPGADEDEMGCYTSSISASSNQTNANEENTTSRPTNIASQTSFSSASIFPTTISSNLSTTVESTKMNESVQVQNTTIDPSLRERTTSSNQTEPVTTSDVVIETLGTPESALTTTDKVITTESEDILSNHTSISQNAFSRMDISTSVTSSLDVSTTAASLHTDPRETNSTSDVYDVDAVTEQASTENETIASTSSVPFTSLSPGNTLPTGINTSTTAYISFNDTSQTETSTLANLTSVSSTKLASELSTGFTVNEYTNTTETVPLLPSSTETLTETPQQSDTTHSQVTEFQSNVSTYISSTGFTSFKSVTSDGNNATAITTSQSSSIQPSTDTRSSAVTNISSTLETTSRATTSSEHVTTSSQSTTSSERATTFSQATTSSERETISSQATRSSEYPTAASQATTSSERATSPSHETTSTESSTSRSSSSSSGAATTSSTETLLLNTSTSATGIVDKTMSIASHITETPAISSRSETPQEANITMSPVEISSVNERLPTTPIDNQTTMDNGTTVLTVTVGDKASLFYENFGLFVFLIVASAVLAGIGIFGIIGCMYQRRLRTWKPSMAYQDAYLAFEKPKYPFRHGIESPIPDFDILRDEKLMKEEETSLSQASTLALASTPGTASLPLDDTYGAETEVRTPSAMPKQPDNDITHLGNGHTNEAFVADETVNIADDTADGIVPVDELDKSPPRTLFPWIKNAEDTKL